MIRNIRITIFSLCLALAFASCQNGGRIGKLFGSWVLEEMSADGEPLPLPAGVEAGFISFQGVFVRFSIDYGMEQDSRSFATWTRVDDTITFDFDHYSDGTEPGTGGYAPPAWLFFDRLEETITISRLDNSHFDFFRTGSDGMIYTYKFKRTW